MAAPELPADFRSDTLTRPGAAMRQAMAEAPVGDDVYGEDPTIRQLEHEAASFLGQQASLFVPSGTMANQIAIHVHCRPGDELICDVRSHVFLFEGGSAARLSGTQIWPFESEDGFPTAEQVEARVRGDDPHLPRSRLLILENTHNMAGGRVLRRPRLASLIEVAHRHGLRVHVDGARLANAAVACAVSAAELVAGVDSVSLCFSKGLGAPVGSVLAGPEDFINAARRVRKAFGGGMRQAGILAAAARMALRDGPGAMARDHQRAQRMAKAFVGLPGLSVALEHVESNILMLDLTTTKACDFVSALAARGVAASAVGPARVRFVLHQDVADEHVDRCIDAVQELTQNSSG